MDSNLFLGGSHYFGWAATLLFITVGVLFLAFPILAGGLIRPNNPSKHKGMSYECGEEPIGDSWIRFNPRYYIVALIFVLFDVEIIFMYPWAVAFGQMKAPGPSSTMTQDGMGNVLFHEQNITATTGLAITEMLIFVGILVVGFVYLWRYGYLEWVTGITPDASEDWHDDPRVTGGA